MPDPSTEYLRRNTAHANAVGAHANTKSALARLLKMKRPPAWLIGALEGIERRTAIVHPEVAAWRDSAPDNPYRVGVPDAQAAIAYALERWGYKQGTSQCVAFYRGACWAVLATPAPAPAHCGSYECRAAQQDGIVCADGECDRANGVRPDSVGGNDGR